METLIFWLAGSVLCLVAVPFFPRKDASSPLQALGFAVMLGALWPLMLAYFLVKVLPWWYLLQWVDYRQFLNKTRRQKVVADHEDNWQDYNVQKHPQAYEQAKTRLDADLAALDAKADALEWKRIRLEDRLKA
jgi:hypothetical protein